MFKQSPSRNHRSKGFKVKHVLQICLLLAVCFWLIYQVKHSHDKKKEFDTNDAKISARAQNSDEILNLGRKVLHPQVVKTPIKSEKHVEEEEETEVEEENKHEEEDQEGEVRIEEREDDGRGGGDDEIDEHDQERTEGEAYREEDFIEEEKGREEDDEKEAEENEDQIQNESSLEDQEHDSGGRNTHGAREEHYKGDDASSAVAHDSLNTETENISFENPNENAVLNILEQDNKFNNSVEIGIDQNHPGLKAEEGEIAGNGTSLNGTAIEEKGNETPLAKSEDDRSLQNLAVTESKDQPEAFNNSTAANTETPGLSLQNRTETILDSTLTQNETVEGTTAGEGQMIVQGQVNNSNTASVDNQSDSNSTASAKNENADAESIISEKIVRSDVTTEGEGGFGSPTTRENTDGTQTEKLDTSNKTGVRSDSTAEAEDSSGSFTTKKNTNATQNEKLDIGNATDGTGKSSGFSSANEDAGTVVHDPIDSSDSSIPQEEKDAHTDPDRLPEIRTGMGNSEEAVAE